MAKDYTFEKRKYILGAIVVCIVLIYILRLAGLQIFSDKYKRYADSNAFLNKIQYPSRGAIYDRNGKLLVFNQPAYDITFIPREVTAAVPSLTPLVTNGDSGSFGIAFLLQVIFASSSRFSITFPVIPVPLKSTSIR